MSAQFLNSFFAEDLRRVGKAIEKSAPGDALRGYVTPAHEINKATRIDVEQDLAYVRNATASKNIPQGRWPSASEQKPGLGQQLALNTILTQNKSHLFAVNGPPGTGKTVMLRDLLAAIVVQRATQLADLKNPKEAFADPIAWNGANRKVHPPKPNLIGYELVLACATNAAAENVSAEIPARDAIDEQWHGKTDYFTETATKMLNPKDCDPQREAWAMVSAVLGSRYRNKTFVSKFWFEGMNEALKKSAPAEEWKGAVKDFRERQTKVSDIERELARYSDLFEQLAQAERQSERSRKEAEAAEVGLPEIEAQLAKSREAAELARNAVERCEKQRSEHRQTKPSVWDWLRTLGRAGREWRAQDKRIAGAIAAAEDAATEAGADEAKHAKEAAKRAEQVERHRSEWRAAHAKAQELNAAIPKARKQWEAEHPSTVFPDEQWEQPEQQRAPRARGAVDRRGVQRGTNRAVLGSAELAQGILGRRGEADERVAEGRNRIDLRPGRRGLPSRGEGGMASAVRGGPTGEHDLCVLPVPVQALGQGGDRLAADRRGGPGNAASGGRSVVAKQEGGGGGRPAAVGADRAVAKERGGDPARRARNRHDLPTPRPIGADPGRPNGPGWHLSRRRREPYLGGNPIERAQALRGADVLDRERSRL